MPSKAYVDDINRSAIVWANLDTSHYSIAWYVVKDQADAWHVDGVIVEKSVPVNYYSVTYTRGAHGSFEDQKYENLSSGTKTPDFNGNPTDNSGWSFIGWSPALESTVTRNMTYTAQWSNGYVPPPTTYFTVTYVPGAHGTFPKQEYKNLISGALTPAFDGNLTGDTGWTFTGWSPTVSTNVFSDRTYVAQWQENATPPTVIPESPPPLGPTPVPVTPIPENPVPGAATPVIAPTVTPQTGDNSNILLLAILAVFSAAGLGTVGIITRKKKRSK